jgi:hypothetical protein
VLRKKGYDFVGLDQVPALRSALLVERQVVLMGADGSIVAQHPLRREEMVFRPPRQTGEGALGLVQVGEGRLALRAGNGKYMSAALQGGEVFAAATRAGPAEWFTVEPESNGVRFRFLSGYYLARGGTGNVRLTAQLRGHAELFRVGERFPVEDREGRSPSS